MASFLATPRPTPFGFFDSDPAFQLEADSMVNFVSSRLGGNVLSVELTRKDIWTCFENAVLDYANLMAQYQMKSDLSSLMGSNSIFSGSVVSGTFLPDINITETYIQKTLEFAKKQAEAYDSYAAVGGNYDTYLAYINVVAGKQDYNLYTDLKRGDGPMSGSLFMDTMPSGSTGKIRVLEVMHFEPLAAQNFLLNASNITNFLATNFNYESYVNSTVFYVLPVYEDVLRRTMLETAARVRRSNYSYQINGRTLRIYPIPSAVPYNPGTIWLRVMPPLDPLNPTIGFTGSITTSSIASTNPYPGLRGISNPSQIPYGNIVFGKINAPGRHWIREMTLALCKETLGWIRTKMKSLPIPNAEISLNGDDLLSSAKEDKERLTTQMKELLDELTADKLLEKEATKAEFLHKQLRYIPTPLGKKITWG